MSPTIFRSNAYRFFFFSNEGSPLEPVHVHVRRGESLAKIYLDPEVNIASNYGFKSRELREIYNKVKENEEKIRTKWNEFFGI